MGRLALLGLLLFSLLVCGGMARADEDAKTLYQRGTALFALHKYGDAAAAYEQAFVLRPDAAILYNAAQAHRLAGNKPRAVELYESLLRLYPDQRVDRREIAERIRQLKLAIAADDQLATAPPVTTLQSPAMPLPSSAATIETRVVVVPVAVTPEHRRRKPWMWGVIAGGAAVVGAVIVGVVVGTSKTVPPTASLGMVNGN